MKTNNLYTIITGASNGLGKFMAIECAKRQQNLILVALPGTGLDRIEYALAIRYNIDIKIFEVDLTDPFVPEMIYNWCKDNSIGVNVLINNAGIGYEGAFDSLTIQFCIKMMQLNMQAVVVMTKLFLPSLQNQPKAYILNVSSLASFTPMPFKSMYAASKTFVFNFSRALRSELKTSNIKISVLCPGPIPTSPLAKARIAAHGWFGKQASIDPAILAAITIKKLIKGKPVIIPGWLNNFSLLMMKIMPQFIHQFVLVKAFKRSMSQLG